MSLYIILRAILISALLTSAATFLMSFFHLGSVARKNFERKRDFFRHYPVQAGDIVLAGDSITDLGVWDDILPGWPIKNRGISAETSKGLLRRMDAITSGKPAAIFLLIGTNDLPWYLFRTIGIILKTYEQIIQRIQAETPETRIYIQSILPRSRWYIFSIHRLNHGLHSLAEEYHCTYVDLYTSFATLRGTIRPEYTNDNLHLLAAGYVHWAELLRPHLQALKDEGRLEAD